MPPFLIWIWSGRRESNPHLQLGRLASCLYTTSASAGLACFVCDTGGTNSFPLVHSVCRPDLYSVLHLPRRAEGLSLSGLSSFLCLPVRLSFFYLIQSKCAVFPAVRTNKPFAHVALAAGAGFEPARGMEGASRQKWNVYKETVYEGST